MIYLYIFNVSVSQPVYVKATDVLRTATTVCLYCGFYAIVFAILIPSQCDQIIKKYHVRFFG